ncbi:MAG: AI-2E family transporter, partial [Roseiflexus sp.]|nr:AI-2E family transporter [Roseiflexus sp.]
MRAVEPQEELQEEAIEASAMPDKAGMTETDQSARTTRATNPLLRLIARWSLVALALYIIGSMLWSTRPVLIPFVIGLVLAYLMAPAVDFFDRWMPRWLAILAVYALGFLGIAATFALIIPPLIEQVARLIRQLPSFSEVQMFVD